MEEQLNLFETVNKRWVEQLWQHVGGEQRDAVVAILARMATMRLESLSCARTQESADES